LQTELIGISQNIQQVKKLINRATNTGLNILVYGETGVGKEVVADILHQQSNRRYKPFVKVNCSAFPDTLLESEMFGYEPGAFTGATRRKPGKLEQADDGILFLDEIGDMPLSLQSKLLHVLEGGDFSPLGSEKAIKMTAWIVSATNRNLRTEVANGNFREDLFFRLNTIEIYIEPLRNRPQDIPLLIDFYVKIYTAQFADKQFLTLSQKAIDKLSAYHWPGNVRELQNVLKRLIVLKDGEDSLNDMPKSPPTVPEATGIPVPIDEPIPPVDFLGFDKNNQPEFSSLSLKKIGERGKNLAEKQAIAYVLEKNHWNRAKSARVLKIAYKTLLTKIKNFDLTPPSK